MDKPTLEFHPHGSLTIHFDDQSVTLRKCRLGDYEYAQNLLQAIRDATKAERERIANTMQELADQAQANANWEITTEEEAQEKFERTQEGYRRLRELLKDQDQVRVKVVSDWLGKVIERMGDSPAPPVEDWPIDLFDGGEGAMSLTINRIIEHWQTRPLASGGSPRTAPEVNGSEPPLPSLSSPKAQPQP